MPRASDIHKDCKRHQCLALPPFRFAAATRRSVLIRGSLALLSSHNWRGARSDQRRLTMVCCLSLDGLAAHRPLGGIMRVRKTVYEEAKKFRAERNGQVIEEPHEMVSFAQSGH